MASAWNDLAARTVGMPTTDALWTRAFWEAFGNGQAPLVLHALHQGGALVAVLPLVRRGGFGSTWGPFLNEHIPYWNLVCDPGRSGAAGEVLDHLFASSDVIELPLLPDRGLPLGLIAEAKARGLREDLHEANLEAYIALSSPWKAFCNSLPENIDRNMQKFRQLERMGKLTFETARNGSGLPALFEECLALEAAGWKGTHGQPIASRPDTLHFYTGLALGAAELGRIALHTLRLDGRLIAFEFCVQTGRRMDAFKIGYDQDLNRQSPGAVLRTLVLRQAVEAGTLDSYHLGLVSPWKRRWANRLEPVWKLRLYRPGLKGALAWAAGPGLRRLLKRSPVLRAIATRIEKSRGDRRRAVRARPKAETPVTADPPDNPTP